jgi:DNA-binding MarR family transcriptional regulator
MGKQIRRQAERLYRVFSELVRGYQFRDREQICCHGLSVSQCYALEALDAAGSEAPGSMTMGELAARLHVKISTMTRLVDQLVAANLVTRVPDARDRRICRVKIGKKGQSLVSRIRADLVEEHEQVLGQIPPASREAVINAMSLLRTAFKERQECSLATGCNRRTKP